MAAMRPVASKMPKGLVRSTVDAIGLSIVNGEFKASEVLPQEETLAERFMVSRSGLREAVKVLSGKGLVRTARRYGSRVCSQEEWNYLDPDVLRWHLTSPANLPQFLRDIGEMRLLLEPAAVGFAVERATPGEIRQILKLAGRLPIASTADTVEIDIAFHLAVLRASHNLIIAGLCPAMDVLLRAYFWSMWKLRPEGPRHLANINLHQSMAQAIADRDGETAKNALTEMLTITCREIDGVLVQFGPIMMSQSVEQGLASGPATFSARVRELSSMFGRHG